MHKMFCGMVADTTMVLIVIGLILLGVWAQYDLNGGRK